MKRVSGPMETPPSVGGREPRRTRRREVLPSPLRPVTPTRVPGSKREGDVGEEATAAKDEPDAVEVHDAVAKLGGRRDDEVELALGRRRGVGLDLMETIEPRAGLAGLGLGASPDPLDLAPEKHLALVLGEFLGRELLGSCGEVFGVVALVTFEDAVAKLDDPVGDLVKEMAVVGDDEERAGVVAEVVHEPPDAVGVEVVGGLVEDEDVGAGDDGACEGDAALLAAGELGDGGAGRGASELGERGLDAVVEVPSVEVRDSFLDLGVPRGIAGEHLELGEKPEDMGGAHADVGLDVEGRVEGEGLGQVADEGVALADDLAVVGLEFPDEDLEEGGLAGAVPAHEPDAIAGGEAHGGVVDQGTGVVAENDLAGGDHGEWRMANGEAGREGGRCRGVPSGATGWLGARWRVGVRGRRWANVPRQHGLGRSMPLGGGRRWGKRAMGCSTRRSRGATGARGWS